MKHTKRLVALLLVFAALAAIPVLAAELEPIRVGVMTLDEIPEDLNAADADPNAAAVLALTGQTLYAVTESGEILPSQAALPVDVTAEYAGTYGIPQAAKRGYAFAIDIREDACWEDGKGVSGADWYHTVMLLMEEGRFPLEIANHQAYLRGETKPSDQIISLKEAGFSSAMEAEADGHNDFYIDVTHFWGLDAGWLRITDRSRLEDAAIPSGCEEMYLTAEYLYRTYLGDNGSQSMFQSEFIGIPLVEGEKLTLADVGLTAEENRLVVILQEPAAASYVAAALAELMPVRPGSEAGSYVSCGPYRIVSAGKDELILEPNPHWTGEPAAYEIIKCRTSG